MKLSSDVGDHHLNSFTLLLNIYYAVDIQSYPVLVPKFSFFLNINYMKIRMLAFQFLEFFEIKDILSRPAAEEQPA